MIASRRQSAVIAGSTGVLRRTSMFLSRTSQSGYRSSLQSNESSILKSSLKSSLKASPRSPPVKTAAVTSATTVIYQKQTSKQSPMSKAKKKAPKPMATGVTNVAFESEGSTVADEDDDVFVAPKPRLTIPSLIEEETSLRSSNRTTNRNTDDVTKDDVKRETLEEIHEVGNDDVFEANQAKTLFGIQPGGTDSGPIDIPSDDITMTSSHFYQPAAQHQNHYHQHNEQINSNITDKPFTSGNNLTLQPTSGLAPDSISGSEDGVVTRRPSIHGIKLPSIQNDVPQVAIKTGLLLGSTTKEESKTEIEGLQEFQQQLKNGELPKAQDLKEEVEKKSETKSKKKKRKKPVTVPPEDDLEGLQNLQNDLNGHLQEQPSSLESMKSHQINEDQAKSSRKKKRRKSQKISSDLQATSSAASISPEDQQRLEDIYNRALEEQNFEKPSEGTV